MGHYSLGVLIVHMDDPPIMASITGMTTDNRRVSDGGRVDTSLGVVDINST
jgi:hypothetical protein